MLSKCIDCPHIDGLFCNIFESMDDCLEKSKSSLNWCKSSKGNLTCVFDYMSDDSDDGKCRITIFPSKFDSTFTVMMVFNDKDKSYENNFSSNTEAVGWCDKCLSEMGLTIGSKPVPRQKGGILERLQKARLESLRPKEGEPESLEFRYGSERIEEYRVLDANRSSYLGWTVEELRSRGKKEVLDYIRCRLAIGMESTIEHKRFNMSGYNNGENKRCNTLESKKGSGVGSCTLSNLEVLNTFADLGIYDYTTYLFLDFFKGTPTLYFQYFDDWANIENHKKEFSGWGTIEIIYEIFLVTIFSDEKTRRRD